MRIGTLDFAAVWIVVAGVPSPEGNPPSPRFLAAHEVVTGCEVCLTGRLLRGQNTAPYPADPHVLVVAFGAGPVLAVHLALRWAMPQRILDLHVEFRNLTNGRRLPCGDGLVGALIWFGLPVGGIAGCDDAEATASSRLWAVGQLLIAMAGLIDMTRAPLRGRYMVAVARMEQTGIPIDLAILERLACSWSMIRRQLVDRVDAAFNVYVNSRFHVDRFGQWLDQRSIPWPRLPSGNLDLADGTWSDMARAYPELGPLRELRTTLAAVQPGKLTVGADGRNRTPLRPFASRTGRNQPSSSRSVLGSASWLRHLIKPAPGRGLAFLDWDQQEFGIAAALSGDPAMQAAYRSGDPYLAFAAMAGAAPDGAGTAGNAAQRGRFKTCALGVQYGMTSPTLARLTGLSPLEAHALLRRHQSAFPKFWSWSDAVVDAALFKGRLSTVFGWQVHMGADATPGFLRNFPMQANGAEMLRLACCLTTEAGITVCATMHDALVIEAPLDMLNDAVTTAKRLMAEASSVVLDGFELRSTANVIRAPDRFRSAKGARIWSEILAILGDPDAEDRGPRAPPAHQRDTT